MCNYSAYILSRIIVKREYVKRIFLEVKFTSSNIIIFIGPCYIPPKGPVGFNLRRSVFVIEDSG